MSDRDRPGSVRLPSPVRTLALRPHPALARWRGGVLCRLGSAEVGFWRLRGPRAEPVGHLPLGGSDHEVLRAAVARLRAQAGEGPLVLRLPPRSGLLRFDLLPAEALERLGELLPRRLVELVPWPVETLCVRWWPLRRLADGRVEIALAVIPRTRLEQALTRARELGLEPDLVDFELDDPLAPPRFDLLAPDPRPGRVRRWWPLAAAVVLLLLDGLLLGLWRGERGRIAELEAAIAGLRAEVAALADRSAYRRTLEERLATITAHAAERSGRLALLDRLSRLLPDGVWLERLVVEGRVVRLHGYAPDSAALVRLFERSPLFADTRFLAPALRVRPEGGARPLERFVLETRLVGEVGP